MTKEPRQKAVLVAVKLPDVTEGDFESSLTELGRLVSTLGYDVVGEVIQPRDHIAAAAVLGEGRLLDLAELTGGSGHVGTTAPKKKDKARMRREAEGHEHEREHEREHGHGHDDDDDDEDEDEGALGEAPEPKVQLVAVDHDISPSQARNLERASGTQVLDRTGVIIEIFHRHAKSREARLQVEIARLAYTAPRVRESPSGKERQRGRGAGEAAIELDRRQIRDRIAELKDELARIQAEQGVRRAHRRQARRVALVGYTNAGKSSLMRALTASHVYVEDKLFATLDTTVRALQPEVHPRILVSDTVGFIKKLPHDLVASFKSTLDEAHEASLLLHVVDASDPAWEAQHDVTREVLAEIGADVVPSVLVMNKVDRIAAPDLRRLEAKLPNAWFISAHDPKDVAEVRERIIAFFEDAYEEAELVVPYDRQRLVSEMHEVGKVCEERYEEAGVIVRFRGEPETIARLRSRLA
ncbi:MAG: GTPase HflX [Myxococcales bacterium]|nr:GTPase HflX [Myxococcales bacterium]